MDVDTAMLIVHTHANRCCFPAFFVMCDTDHHEVKNPGRRIAEVGASVILAMNNK
jgi:hypothetical protein